MLLVCIQNHALCAMEIANNVFFYLLDMLCDKVDSRSCDNTNL
jgi:hypothetical protein